MWQYSNHSPNHGHVTPLSQLQRGHLYISPSLRSDFLIFFFFSFFGGPRHSPVVAFCTPPIARRQNHAAHGSMEPQPLPRPIWAPTRHSGPHPQRRGPLRRTSPPPRPVSHGRARAGTTRPLPRTVDPYASPSQQAAHRQRNA